MAAKNPIVKPITPATKVGVAGYDEFNQLAVCYNTEGGWTMHHIRDVRAMTCPICKKGWNNTVESLGDQYGLFQKPVQKNDKGEKYMDYIFSHKTCAEGAVYVQERQMWLDIFYQFKKPFEIEEIPNQYGGAWNTPWYTIKIEDREFTVGARKRVFSVELLGDRNFAKDFDSEGNTTRLHRDGRFIIHAWDKEKAKEYVERLMKLLSAVPA